MAKTTYEAAPEVARIAKRLIAMNHAHLREESVRVEYVFRSDTPKKNGKLTLGVTRKVSGFPAWLSRDKEAEPESEDAETSPYFALVIPRPEWLLMEPRMKEALVDHELTHCATKRDKKGNLQLYIKPHDLEEFNAIVERHGLWRRDVTQFLRSAKKHQGELDFVSEDADAESPAGNGHSQNGNGHIVATLRHDDEEQRRSRMEAAARVPAGTRARE